MLDDAAHGSLALDDGTASACAICGKGSGPALPWAATALIDGYERALCHECVDPGHLAESVEKCARKCERKAGDLHGRAAHLRQMLEHLWVTK